MPCLLLASTFGIAILTVNNERSSDLLLIPVALATVETTTWNFALNWESGIVSAFFVGAIVPAPQTVRGEVCELR